MNKSKDITVLEEAVKAIDDKFGINTVILDISKISSMADHFIITSGANPNQMKAIADEVEEVLYKDGIILNHSEGYHSDSWILLDFGHLIVHVFSQNDREFYNLERVWGDAIKIEITVGK